MIQKYRHHSLPVFRVQRIHGAPGAYLYRKLLAGYATYTHIFPSPVKSKVTRQLIYDDHRPCTHTCMYLFIYLILIYFLYIFIFFLSYFFFLSFFLSYSFFLSFNIFIIGVSLHLSKQVKTLILVHLYIIIHLEFPHYPILQVVRYRAATTINHNCYYLRVFICSSY